jgi:hypothetical protein
MRVEAAITIAASAACGRSVNNGVNSSSVTAMPAAATSWLTWLRAPAPSLTAVREPLVEHAKPPVRADPKVPIPSAIDSRFASTDSPWRTANARAVATASANARIAASVSARLGSPTASGAIVAAVSAASAPSGPTITREVRESSANTIIAPSAAYSPVTGGSPAS